MSTTLPPPLPPPGETAVPNATPGWPNAASGPGPTMPGFPAPPAWKGPSAGVIAALVGGCVAGVAALAAVAWFALGGGAPSPGDRKVVKVGDAEIALRWCPPGEFTMGSPADEDGRDDDETQHRVTLTQGFWLGETEVTQGLWVEVMGDNPSYFKAGDNRPVEQVSWYDCQEFLRRLNAKAPAGWRFALPTETQWEYACRAGTTGAHGGTGSLDDMGWYERNSGETTHPVGQKRPNAWGLRDMHGNVWEWCADWYGPYPTSAATDPSGPSSGSYRVLRGGSWDFKARLCRSASRINFFDPGYRYNYLGFRVALVPVQ